MQPGKRVPVPLALLPFLPGIAIGGCAQCVSSLLYQLPNIDLWVRNASCFMTRKIFWDNPYTIILETRVTSVNGNDIAVEETIFFAFSGGQESDSGTIGGKRVVEARAEGRTIIYTLESDHGLVRGDRIMMEIDWGRRYRLMRLHFAAELVLEIVYKSMESIRKIGAHIAEDKARIDFEWEEDISKWLPFVQREVIQIVGSNENIVSDFSSVEEERRFWKIGGFAQVPCGGTHLRTTGEVGEIVLRRKNPGKGKERIEIYLKDNILGVPQLQSV